MKLNHLIFGTCVSMACAPCSSAESVDYFDPGTGTRELRDGAAVTAKKGLLGADKAAQGTKGPTKCCL